MPSSITSIEQQVTQTLFATAHDTPVVPVTPLRTAGVGPGRRGASGRRKHEPAWSPFQADANEPGQPLTSLPEEQAGDVMSCHCSLQEQQWIQRCPGAQTGLWEQHKRGAMLGGRGPEEGGQGTKKSPSGQLLPSCLLGNSSSHRL